MSVMTDNTHSPLPWIRSGIRKRIGCQEFFAVGVDGAPTVFVIIGGSKHNDHAEALEDLYNKAWNAGFFNRDDYRKADSAIAKARGGVV